MTTLESLRGPVQSHQAHGTHGQARAQKIHCQRSDHIPIKDVQAVKLCLSELSQQYTTSSWRPVIHRHDRLRLDVVRVREIKHSD